MKSPTEFEKEQFAATDLEIGNISTDVGTLTSPDVDNSHFDVFTVSSPQHKLNTGIQEDRDDADFEKRLESSDLTSFPTPTKAKHEARKVCDKISRLLSDKHSRTRGSCMFRKRKRRSERFAIVGYGTQPVEDSKNSESSSVEEETDLSSNPSTDDEIFVYDHPGPNNILEQDIYLSSSEKVIQNQLKNLAMDAVQMKGKGAKLFARRQRRMEKFIIDSSPENRGINEKMTTNETNQSNNLSPAYQYKSNSVVEDGRTAFTPISLSNLHAKESSDYSSLLYQNEPFAQENFPYMHTGQSNSSREEMSKYQPIQNEFRSSEKTPWAVPRNFASADWSSDDELTQRNYYHNSFDPREKKHPAHCNDQQTPQQIRFRSVKPPAPSVANITQATNDEFLPASVGLNLKRPKDCSNKPTQKYFQKPTKKWSSVKFQPKRQEKLDYPEKKEQVDYPFSLPSTNAVTQSPALPSQLTTDSSYQLQRAKKTSPNTRSAFLGKIQSPSVALLEQPISDCGSQHHNGMQILNANVISQPTSLGECDITAVKSVHGDITPKRGSPENGSGQEAVPLNSGILSPSRCSTRSTDSKQTATLSLDQAEMEAKKPKIAACLKLLDPNKGKYEPKMEVTYKQTQFIGSKLNEPERSPSRARCNEPQHFNKALEVNYTNPHLTQDKSRTVSSSEDKKPQALGSMAVGLTGKGAKMFEKQQKRMDRYSKECNGTKEAQLCDSNITLNKNQIFQCSNPEEKTKNGMSQVLGEFKKVSDSDCPKRPSATRRSKGGDPYRYQQMYLSRRLPSAADFVCSEDTTESVSDSNNSTASSMTSYDLASRTSSEKHAEEDANANIAQQTATNKVKIPPKVAPKPKLQRIERGINLETTNNFPEDCNQVMFHKEASISDTCNVADLPPCPDSSSSSILNDSTIATTSEEPTYHIWSPKQSAYKSPTFDQLPLPPTYEEVSQNSHLAPKPTFHVANPNYEVFNPAAHRNKDTNDKKFEVDSDLGDPKQVQPENGAGFICPRPKFTANAPVAKWKPNTNS